MYDFTRELILVDDVLPMERGNSQSKVVGAGQCTYTRDGVEIQKVVIINFVYQSESNCTKGESEFPLMYVASITWLVAILWLPS